MLSATLITDHSDQNLAEEKSKQVEGRISRKSLVAAEVNQRIDHDTLCDVQNKDVQINKSSEPASKTSDNHEEVRAQKKLKKKVQSKNKITNSSKNNNMVQDMMERETTASEITEEHEEVCAFQKKLKKKRSEGRKKSVAESGSEKLSETLKADHFDQNSAEEKSEWVDGKISRNSLVAAEVNQRVDHDTVCSFQCKDVQINKSSEPASETADKHEEVCFQKKLKKNHSERRKKSAVECVSKKLSETLMAENIDGEVSLPEVKKKRHSGRGKKHLLGSGKIDLSSTLVNNHSSQNRVEETSDPLTLPIIASEVQNMIDNSPFENGDVQVSKGNVLESPKENIEEVCLTQQKKRRKKKHADQQKVDDSPFCNVENKDDQVGEGLGSESPRDDEKDVCLTQKKRKRKEKKHTDKNNKNMWESGCQHVSDTSDTKGLGLDIFVPATSGLALVRNEKINKVLSDCVNINSTNNDYLCNENEISSVDVQSKTHRRKDKTRSESSFDPLNASENKEEARLKDEDELNPRHKVIPVDTNTEKEKLSTHQEDPKLEFGRKGHDTLSQNDKVLSVEGSLTNQSNKRSLSKKKRRKNKKKHSSDQANAFDNLSTSDPFAKHDCSVSEGAIEASFNNCRVEETSPSAEYIKKEATIMATESTKDELQNRSASPGTGQIRQSSRKLLILDLNGLLVDIVPVLPRGCRADKRIGKKSLIKRPFCDDFVKFCFETFNVGVWSSRTKINVDKVVDFIMGDYKHKLLFCWHQSQCTPTGFNTLEVAHKPMVFKEIKKLWDQRVPGLPWTKGEYNESNTLLLDDSPYKALLNPPHTAIFPDSYKCWNANDNALGPGGKIREYLEGIATAEDVQKYVEHNPFGQRAVTSRSSSWGYYLRIIRANRFCLPIERKCLPLNNLSNQAA
ncbi:hypothetical protein ACHQM5_007808 [Ranunculus cassubicifolius]